MDAMSILRMASRAPDFSTPCFSIILYYSSAHADEACFRGARVLSDLILALSVTCEVRYSQLRQRGFNPHSPVSHFGRQAAAVFVVYVDRRQLSASLLLVSSAGWRRLS